MEKSSNTLPQADDTPEGRLRRRYAEILADKNYLDGGSPKHKTLQKEREEIWRQLQKYGPPTI